ncbi:Pentatricopeptide repeat-containing protein [Vigna angularis]|uniref:Pentatricopeptide repeat-containing protein n=1 Tax=Phaseolus angularis TaxID=3914 RepID=A0A8T0L503_PHAAN|nr:Pentatricopeptide repeat-containing protein [Vigna angularis]
MCKKQQYKEALDAFDFNLEKSDQFTFGSIIKACCIVGDIDLGRQLHGHVIKSGYDHHLIAQNALISMYTKFGQIAHASSVFAMISTKDLISWASMITGYTQLERAFYQIESPDLVSWNAIIAAFSDSGHVNEAVSFFRQMMHTGFMPDDITFLSLLCPCGSFLTCNQGMQMHSYIIKVGLDKEAAVCNSLLTMYTKCSNLHNAFNVFTFLGRRANLVSWNSILSACLQHKHAREAFRLFKLMLFSENKPDSITITTILGTCAELSSLERENAVDNFRVVKTWVLVATDVVSRGIDLKGVNCVMILSDSGSAYVHRIGHGVEKRLLFKERKEFHSCELQNKKWKKHLQWEDDIFLITLLNRRKF